jgi:hypothetical protein
MCTPRLPFVLPEGNPVRCGDREQCSASEASSTDFSSSTLFCNSCNWRATSAKASESGSRISLGSVITTRLPLRKMMCAGTPTIVELSETSASHHRSGSHPAIFSDYDIAQNLRAGPSHDIIAKSGMAFSFLLTGPRPRWLPGRL